MLQIKSLSKKYQMKDQEVPVLNSINCSISKGEFVAILGPSGCGKSTLLNILAGLDQENEGEILYEGKSTRDFLAGEWDTFRKEHIGIVFQNFNLIPHLTALQNVELAMSVAAWSKGSRRKRAKELLKRVELGERMKNKPNQLSGGERQRVAIARALANNPEIILADEPTGALDSKTSKEIMGLFHTLNQEYGVTIIMVTHNEQIAQQTDRNICMLDGKIISDEYFVKLSGTDAVNSEAAETVVAMKNTVGVKNAFGIKDAAKMENTAGFKAALSPEKGKTATHMKAADSIAIALRNILLKKRRSILTMIGISVGIFSVLIMFGISSGVANKVSDELDSISNASIVKVDTQNYSGEELEGIAATVEGNSKVTATEEVFTLVGTIAYQGKQISSTLVSYTGESGEDGLIAGEIPKGEGEIAITKNMAEECMGKNAAGDMLGKTVTIYVAYSASDDIVYSVEKECRVVGITLSNLLGIGYNYISYDYAKAISRESAGREVNAQKVFIYLKDRKDRNEVVEALKEKGYSIATAQETIDKINLYIGAVQKFMLLITGISLVVACVMVIIVQYMSVAERVKEIGILRAIGAKRQDVRNIFLLEAGVIGLCAGMIGIAFAAMFGSFVNEVVRELMANSAFHLYYVTGPVLLGCLAISIGLCLIAGYLPARKASTVDPIEVLR